MKRILTLFLALALPLTLLAQTPQEDYVRRYNNLISRVGPAGVGVETLLDKWAEEYPDDTQQLLARFSFWFTKAQTTKVIQLPQDRYLGREPLLNMKDSLGRKNNFFEDTEYDDESFGLSLEALDKAVALKPEKLDFRLLRIDALTAYEKGSPDMALSALKALVDENYKRHPAWTHESLEKVDNEVFNALIQDYCFTFFRLGTDSSAEAFKSLSEHMLTYSKDDPEGFQEGPEILRPGAQEASGRHHRHPQRHPPRPSEERREAGEEVPGDDGPVRRDRDGQSLRLRASPGAEPEKIAISCVRAGRAPSC